MFLWAEYVGVSQDASVVVKVCAFFPLLILSWFSFSNFVVLIKTFVVGGVHSPKRTRVLFSKGDKSSVQKSMF